MINIGVLDQLELQTEKVSEYHRALKATFGKSLKQREKMVKLIQSIDHQDMTVLHFTAYRNFSKQLKTISS